MQTHRFGLLTPSSNTTQEPEFSAALPAGVSLHTGRVSYRDITPEEQMRCVLELESESRKLADADVGVIVFAATAPTVAKGKGYDRELIKRMEDVSGRPATTAATAFVDALTRLGVMKLAIGAPWSKTMDGPMVSFMEANGFQVVNSEVAGYVAGVELGRTGPEAAYELARRVDRPDAEAIILPGGNWPAMSVVERLERELGKPVLANNAVSLWAGLRLLKRDDRIAGYGRLLSGDVRCEVAEGERMLTRRSLVAAAMLAPVAARSQTSGPVRIINPFAAGGTSDAMARLLQPSLQQRLGATVIVENRPGASASIGAASVAKSPPDGTTWLLTSDTFVVSTLLLSGLPYDVQKDFAPVTMIARGPMVLCAHPSRPYRTLPDLIAAAQARPGVLTYGTTGLGSNGHLTMAALCGFTGMRLVHVPYRGAAPVLNDGTAGHVDMVISSSATMAPQIESGQLHPIVQFGDQRASFLPNTPTAIEHGIAGLHAYSWFGFFGPAATPKPIVDRFYREVAASVREEANYSAFVNKFRCEVPLPTPDELRQMIVEELPFWAGIIRDNNIKGGS